jgi:hypothetical protein
MAWWHDSTVEDMPEHLARFRPADWVDVDALIDPAFDPWEPFCPYARPRAGDAHELHAAYALFRAARDEWERDHPAWVQREVDEMVRRRIERRRRTEQRRTNHLLEEES